MEPHRTARGRRGRDAMTSPGAKAPGGKTPGGKAQGPLPPLLLVLTVVTGVVDAVSILRLGRVFVANMTGNVVFTGFALVGAPGFSLSASLAALAGFLAGALLVGAVLGGSLASRLGHDRGLLLRGGAAAELVLVSAALALTAATGLATAAGRVGDAALLALAMGIQNAVARRLAVPDLTTTVLTMTLTGIAADVRAKDHGLAGLGRRVLAVATMFAGAACGALLVLHAGATAALGLAVGLLAMVTAAATLATRRPGSWRAG
ncbi:MAG: YoaK family protein [Streptosporangiaceae bacterium]